MLESKRKFRRFDLPLIVKFRPTGGKAQYSLGLLKNISCDGLSLEAREFNFVQNENLEMELKFPQGNAAVFLHGDVMWKRKDGNISYAGVRFLAQSESAHNEIMEKISNHANIPIDVFLNNKNTLHRSNEKEAEVKAAVQKNKAPIQVGKPSLIKQYLEDRSQCRVLFRLPKEAAPDAQEVTIAGDFNAWDISRTHMSKRKSGDFSVSLDLDCGREYRFKYLIDGSRWENDWFADKYVPNDFGTDDSVVIT
jgi:hypothetical protein